MRLYHEFSNANGIVIPAARCRTMNLPATNIPQPPRTRGGLGLTLLFTIVFAALGLVSRARTNAHLAWTFGGVAVFLVGWQLWLFLASRRRPMKFAWEFVAVRAHYVQALVQFAIYVYWGWYWRNVYGEFPLILSQIAFLYAFDGLLSWSRGQTWRVGFGPWPIIFSTNLFMWFKDDWFIFQFLMVATGVLGKQYIRWQRDGKLTHIFNPSAFGLTLFSLALIFTGTTDHTWGVQIALTQGRPPHLFTEIFLCGLVVQYFFSVTLLTFSAVLAIGLSNLVYMQATGVYLFVNSNIPIAVFLGLHLLMTDPATTPRSSLGRVIFGGLYGVGVCVAFWILDAQKLPSFYYKLVVVPLLNLLAPLLDRVTAWGVMGKYGLWEQRVGPRKLNLAYMSCWMAVFALMLGTGYVEARHPGETIDFWARAAEEKRPNATKYLLRFLRDFDQQDLSDASLAVGEISNGRQPDRNEALGQLCNEVAAIYAQGKLIPADPVKACHYFARSCDFGDAAGCANLAAEYLATGTAEAEAEARQALARLEGNDVGATNGRVSFLVGYSYDIGRGNAVDKAKARQFYERAAALGDLSACKNLGRMQLAGEGGPRDATAAAGWWQKAADGKDGPCCLYLARLYHTGDGVAHDEERANALLEKACDLGVQPACELLKSSKK